MLLLLFLFLPRLKSKQVQEKNSPRGQIKYLHTKKKGKERKGVKRDSQGLGCSDEDGGAPKDGEAEMLFKLVWRRQADTQTRSLGWKA